MRTDHDHLLAVLVFVLLVALIVGGVAFVGALRSQRRVSPAAPLALAGGYLHARPTDSGARYLAV